MAGFGGCALTAANLERFTMNKQISKAMKICAEQVREVSCAHCLNYEKCVRNGHKPISMLGKYLAWLDLEALPAIEREMRPMCSDGLKLEAHAPNMTELCKDAFAVVRVYLEANNKRSIVCRVLLLDNDYDAAKLRTMIFNEYIRKYRKG